MGIKYEHSIENGVAIFDINKKTKMAAKLKM